MHVCVTRWAPSSSKADVPLCYFPSRGLETLLCWRAKTSIRITFAQESFPLNTPVCGGIPGFLDQRVHRNMNILLFSFSQPENVLSNLSDPPIFKYLEQIFFAVFYFIIRLRNLIHIVRYYTYWVFKFIFPCKQCSAFYKTIEFDRFLTLCYSSKLKKNLTHFLYLAPNIQICKTSV